MEWTNLPQLPSIHDRKTVYHAPENLSLVYPAFSIPSLGDVAHDPILAKLRERVKQHEHKLNGTTLLMRRGSPKHTERETQRIESQTLELFASENVQPTGPVTWDALYSQTRCPVLPSSALLSEQSSHVVVPALEHVLPQLQGSIIRLSVDALKDFLQCLVYGEATHLFQWDVKSEYFILAPGISGIMADDLSPALVHSLSERFIAIGTLLRRLEVFALAFRLRKVSHELHAMVHVLQAIIRHIRVDMIDRQLTRKLIQDGFFYEESLQLLSVVAGFCGRHLSLIPPYPDLPQSSKGILDHVFDHASSHISLATYQRTRAVSAYVLSRCTSPWCHSLSIRTGLNPQLTLTMQADRSVFPGVNSALDVQATTHDADDPVQIPSFVPPRESRDITRGVKSLNVLRVAQPSHPVCKPVTLDPPLGWVWTEDGVENAVSHLEIHLAALKRRISAWRRGITGLQAATGSSQPSTQPSMPKVLDLSTMPEQLPASKYLPELNGLEKFDLEPGTQPQTRSAQKFESEVSVLTSAIQSFPDSLPPMTATVFQIAQTTIVQPLAAHCRLLSSCLLDLVLTDLHLLSHLDVISRFMLFGDPQFVARLRGALFDERDFSASAVETAATWGAGLNPTLSPSGEWPPPGGYGVSYLLRNVTVETLMTGSDYDAETVDGAGRVLKEAEWRMGFVIREGIEGIDGMGKRPSWTDPKGLMALSFLHLQYAPPATLDILITPVVLSKAERVFDFLLTLLRVDSVARSIFLSTFKKPILTKRSTQRLLQSFCRQMQVFLAGLTGYIFDSAIEHHWKTFSGRLKKLRPDLSVTGHQSQIVDDGDDGDEQQPLRDVFSILDYLSSVLDKILAACFLKSRQHAATATLKVPLDIILAVGQLLRDLATGRVSEDHVAKRLGELYQKWQTASRNLAKSLRELDARGQAHRSTASDSVDQQDLFQLMKDSGAARELGPGDLLLRLDPTAWYAKKAS